MSKLVANFESDHEITRTIAPAMAVKVLQNGGTNASKLSAALISAVSMSNQSVMKALLSNSELFGLTAKHNTGLLNAFFISGNTSMFKEAFNQLVAIDSQPANAPAQPVVASLFGPSSSLATQPTTPAIAVGVAG